jgi:hypothetical protein
MQNEDLDFVLHSAFLVLRSFSERPMPKPGYQTTEHAVAWAVVVLGAIAMWKATDPAERVSGLLSPALASAAYSLSRGRAKSSGPLDVTQTLAELFRQRACGRQASDSKHIKRAKD